MKIITYVPTNSLSCSALARILLDDGTFHPILISRGSPEEAADAAQTWWETELAKERAREQPRRRKTATQKTPAEPDVGDVI